MAMFQRSKIIFLAAVIILAAAYIYYAPLSSPFSSVSPTPTPDYSAWRSYVNQKYGIALKYPNQFTLNPGQTGPRAEWQLYGLVNGTEILSIQIPRSFQPRTTFSDASLRVGFSADPIALKECLNPPSTLGYDNLHVQRKIGGISFSAFSRSEAGAGNFYEITSYRAMRNGGCEVFEYVVHDTSLSNYPAESRVKEYDKAAVESILESILYTVQFVK